MKYLLIVLVIAMVISPLLWLRQTPGQARITAFRNRALQLGLKVQMVPHADAEETERRPETVRYLKSPAPDDKGILPVIEPFWTLVRAERRGRESPFPGWRWHRSEAPAAIHPAIGQCLAELPASVTALRLDGQGVSAYWEETGRVEDVARIETALTALLASMRAPEPIRLGRNGAAVSPRVS
ncbi:MAG: hypothetical protein WDA10_08395 [Porticoccaceae bacterium]